MVRSGWALAYRQYGLDYVEDEEAASATREGIWETTFMPPWEWRQRLRSE
jgi:endonuclease YncB( thermonuclease family)